MQNVCIAFKTLDDNDKIPPGNQWMQCHMIFTVKTDGFICTARLVAGGHMTDTPAVMTYASVVSRETVRIALSVTALNDLEVKTSDIQNAYLTAPCEEKIWTTLGPAFGPDKGKQALIVHALYGLSSARASFGRHLADCMHALGYSSCKEDADLWYKPMTRPDDNVPYYAYVLLYVDNCMAISHDAASTLREIDKFFPMKPGSIGDPDVYLGGKLRKIRLPNGVFMWANSSSKYVKEIVANVEKHIGQNHGGRKLNKRAEVPWPSNYAAEDDTTPELDEEWANYYQHLIGILHWTLELGRVDIITEVSILVSRMAAPRMGHLDAA